MAGCLECDPSLLIDTAVDRNVARPGGVMFPFRRELEADFVEKFCNGHRQRMKRREAQIGHVHNLLASHRRC